jgi:DnaJ-domain-containing protein 1
MSRSEVIVIIACLAIGYWLVSLLLRRQGSRQRNHTRGSQENKPDAPERDCGRERKRASDSEEFEKSPSGPDDPAPWFQVLGVSQNASREEISAAYKLKIGQYQPDKVSRMGEDIRRLAEVRSKQINAAYRQALSEAR